MSLHSESLAPVQLNSASEVTWQQINHTGLEVNNARGIMFVHIIYMRISDL